MIENLKILEERKAAAAVAWNAVYARMLAGEKVLQEEVLKAMERCNAIDWQLVKIKRKQYMKNRKEWDDDEV